MTTDDARDDAERACMEWIRTWRDSHRTQDRPSLTFARHLGVEAVNMAVEGVARVELMRLFAASGYDGVCVCGQTPEAVIHGNAA